MMNAINVRRMRCKTNASLAAHHPTRLQYGFKSIGVETKSALMGRTMRTVARTPLSATLDTPPPPVVQNEVSTDVASASEQFVWARHWYPLCEERDLVKNKPMPFQLLGKGVVVWFDPLTSSWKAFRDLCPHRLIPLSEGRINEKGHLECGYHGWEFNGTGTCETIPQALPEAVGHKAERACVENYACTIKQGLLWVKPTPLARLMVEDGSTREEDIPIVEEVATQEGWVMGTVTRDLPYDYATLLENVLDVSHVPFTHHGSVGNRKNASDVDLKVVKRDKDGFVGHWPVGPRRGYFGPQDTRFVAPSFMRHTLDCYETRGLTTMTIVYAVPVAPGKCRLIARFPFKFKSPVVSKLFALTPRWMSHPGQMSILEDDQVFLHAQEREIAELAIQTGKDNVGQLYYMPTSADAFVTAFRSWLGRYAGGGPFGSMITQSWLNMVGAKQSNEQLLDRYHSHTKNCSSCSVALKRFNLIESLLKLVAPVLIVLCSLVAAAATATKATTLLGLPVLTVAVVLGVKGVAAYLLAAVVGNYKQRYLKGAYPPPRNLISRKK